MTEETDKTRRPHPPVTPTHSNYFSENIGITEEAVRALLTEEEILRGTDSLLVKTLTQGPYEIGALGSILLKLGRVLSESEFLAIQKTSRNAKPNEEIGLLCDYSLGAISNDVQVTRYVPISVFLDCDKDAEIEKNIDFAISRLCKVFGFSVDSSLPTIYSSIWKRLYLKTIDTLTSPEFSDRLKKVERAAQLELLDKTQSGIEKQQAEAINLLLSSISSTSRAVIQIGSILLIKLPSEKDSDLFVVSLSEKQIRHISDNPNILTEPESIMSYLNGSENISLRHNDQVGDGGAC